LGDIQKQCNGVPTNSNKTAGQKMEKTPSVAGYNLEFRCGRGMGVSFKPAALLGKPVKVGGQRRKKNQLPRKKGPKKGEDRPRSLVKLQTGHLKGKSLFGKRGDAVIMGGGKQYAGRTFFEYCNPNNVSQLWARFLIELPGEPIIRAPGGELGMKGPLPRSRGRGCEGPMGANCSLK